MDQVHTNGTLTIRRVDMALSIALIFAVSVLLIFDDTFPLSYLPPRSLSFGFICIRLHSSRLFEGE